VAKDPWLRSRVGVIGELAGSCFTSPHPEQDSTRLRGLSALLRVDLSEHVAPGQLAVSASSLCADSPLHERTLLAHLVASIAANRGCGIPTAASMFWDRYSDCLGTAMVILLSGYGIGLEAHLQNTVVLLDNDYVPRRLLLRDFGGVRIHVPRLAQAGYRYSASPGSVTSSNSMTDVRIKTTYACLQANLAEIVLTLVSQCGLDAGNCWRGVWARMDRAWEYVARHADAIEACLADREAVSSPTALQKAFVTMALHPDTGDHYVEVPNPLHDAARRANTVLRP
jgi:siderophore synthetase component